jgi:hypothetical protein
LGSIERDALFQRHGIGWLNNRRNCFVFGGSQVLCIAMEAIKDRWQKLGVSRVPQDVLGKWVHAYSAPERSYHNLAHIPA